MTAGAVAGSRLRSGGTTPANIIANGTFTDATGWSELGYDGKSVAGGKLVFANTGAYDAAQYLCSPVAGKYYELTYTISSYTAGNVAPGFFGGTTRTGTIRTANGTYTERLLVNTGNNSFFIWTQDVSGTFQIDNVTLIGPYNTSTVGGA